MLSMNNIQDLTDVGPLIRTLRSSRGLTQAQLAKLAGISRTRLSVIESGAADNIEVSTLLRLVGALGARLTVERGSRPNLNQILRQLDAERSDEEPKP